TDNPPGSAVAVVPIGDLDIFVRHIAEAERRAAQIEAASRAKDAMIQFLRERVADLEAQLQSIPADPTPREATALSPTVDLPRLASEIRDLRARFQRIRPSRGEVAEVRQALRVSYAR